MNLINKLIVFFNYLEIKIINSLSVDDTPFI